MQKHTTKPNKYYMKQNKAIKKKKTKHNKYFEVHKTNEQTKQKKKKHQGGFVQNRQTCSASTQNSKRSFRHGMSSVCAFPFVMATNLGAPTAYDI